MNEIVKVDEVQDEMDSDEDKLDNEQMSSGDMDQLFSKHLVRKYNNSLTNQGIFYMRHRARELVQEYWNTNHDESDTNWYFYQYVIFLSKFAR